MPGPESDPSPEVRALILGTVDSFEKLELVLLLARSSEPLDVAAITATLGWRTAVVEYAIDLLARAGAVIEEPAGAWQTPRSGALADAVAELVTLHDQQRTRVMNLMAEAALTRLRESAARAFADAFVLRKGPKGGDDDG